MNGPYRTAACVDAAAEQHACSPALCCACPSCRSASQLLARLAAQAPSPRRTGLGARVSRAAAAATLGVVSGVLVVAVGIAAGSATSVHDACMLHRLVDRHHIMERRIADLDDRRRAAEQRFAEERSARQAAEQEARSARQAAKERAAELAAQERPIPWPPFLLGHSGPESHDPDVLLTRALRFVRDGLDLKIERTTLSPAELTEAIGAGSWPVLPFKHKDVLVGFVLDPARDAHDAGPLRRLGLERGDVITAVNGHPLSSPDRAIEAYSHVRDRQKALFEILRGQRRVVLLVQLR